MNKDQLFYGIIGAIIGGVAVWISMNFTQGSVFGPNRMMGAGTPVMMGYTDQIDAHFIEQMIPHHEDAITMAELALEHAQRDEVKQLARNIIDSQSGEIEEMKQWYKDWYGRDLPVGDEVMQHHGMMSSNGMHMGRMGDETDILRLTESDNFDRVFLQEMIPHHQMAVMMASMLKNGTDREEMKSLADDIITAQSDEIEQMRVWLNSWE